ncbi:hypothetical protein HID58_087480 [Brassica napus]|uniref:Uncharacterized protein n=1 Tax=Brassica napus TaxID=3708 RepID=A0ABQ7XTD8_BRANA|nr:hypothetical protein HID58_087480 [Brassica napus]
MKGDKIHASLEKDLANQFNPFLAGGRSKNVTNFSLIRVKHLYKISFMSTTVFTKSSDFNYKTILEGTLNSDYLIDLIGHIVEVTHLEVVPVNGKVTKFGLNCVATLSTITLFNSIGVVGYLASWSTFSAMCREV